jgi:hypothetical protein
MSRYYILEGRIPVQCDDVLEWGKWYRTAERVVAQESVGEAIISTVFLGFDHGWGDLKPIVFQTMVFGGLLDQEHERYYTWEEAEAGHKKMVERVKGSWWSV